MGLLDTYARLQALKQHQQAQQMNEIQAVLTLTQAIKSMRDMERTNAMNTEMGAISPTTDRITSGITNLPEGYDVADPTSMMQVAKPRQQIWDERANVLSKYGQHQQALGYEKEIGDYEQKQQEETRRRAEDPIITIDHNGVRIKGAASKMAPILGRQETLDQRRIEADRTEEYRRDKLDSDEKHRATLAAIKGSKGSSLSKPPVGFRYDENDELEPTPGGPQDIKIQKQYSGDKGRVDNISKTLDILKTKAKELKDNPALGRVLGVSSLVPDYPGGKAADARKALSQIKDRIMIDTLKGIKELSQNGSAGFGQLTEKEGSRLENYITTLDNAQSEKAVIKALGEIEDYADYLKSNLRTTFSESYSEKLHNKYGKKSSAQQTTPQSSGSRFTIKSVK